MPELNSLIDIASLQKILLSSVLNVPKQTDLDLKLFLDPDYSNAFKIDTNSYSSTTQTVSNPTLDFMLDFFKHTNLTLVDNFKKRRIKDKNLDPNEVQLNGETDTTSIVEGSPAELKSLPEKEQAPGLSVNLSLGQWGDLGVSLGQMAGNIIGGNVGTAISRAATGTQTSINAIKNLKELKGLDPEKFKGLNTAKAGNIAALAGAASSVADAFLGEKSEYSGDKGSITLTMDQVYDGISDAAMSMGPVGCVCAGSRVVTNSGKFVNIENLKQEEGIIGWGNKTINKENIFAFKEPQYKECVRLELESGTILECSIDHPILSCPKGRADRITINGKRIRVKNWQFKRADLLEIGENIGIANDVDIWGSENMWNPYLIGLLIGDGTYGKDHGVRMYSGDSDTWNYIELNKLGEQINFDDSNFNKEFRAYRIFNGPVYLRNLGIYEQTHLNKRLPKNIEKYNKESICKLIAGLIDTDGCVHANPTNKEYKILFYLTNEILIKQIRELLLKLGIHCSILITKEKESKIKDREIKSKSGFKLVIKDKLSLLNFCNNILLNLKYKQDTLNSIKEHCLLGFTNDNRYLSGAKADKLIKITPIGLLLVYNLQADDDHTYIANGVITHNTLVGGAMKVADLLGDGLGKLGGGTSGMTTQDAILGSSFFSWNVGLINGFGGKKVDTITKDEDVFATVGSSYTGANNKVDDAVTKSGKKYGLFSRHAANKADALIRESKIQLLKLEGISNQARDRFNLQGSMSAINANRREYDMMGGYNNIRVGKLGLKFSITVEGELPVPLFKVGGELPELKVISFLLGGEIPEKKEYIPKNIKELIKFVNSHKNVNFVKRLRDAYRETIPNWEIEETVATHKLGYAEDRGKIKVFPMIQEINGELHDFTNPKYNHDKWDALENADKNGDIIIFDNELDAEWFTKHYKEFYPTFNDYSTIKKEIESFKNGGEFNVIPEGALHKNKHHMDMEGITKKGIPVVTDDGELTAEIEREEIIFRLEVTETLEKLYKIYNSEDSKLKDKDEAALEAGKLLVYEILHNTIDNTNLINKI